jgi:hypothetical protein
MGISLCTELAGAVVWSANLHNSPTRRILLTSISITNKQFKLEMHQFADLMGLEKGFLESFRPN